MGKTSATEVARAPTDSAAPESQALDSGFGQLCLEKDSCPAKFLSDVSITAFANETKSEPIVVDGAKILTCPTALVPPRSESERFAIVCHDDSYWIRVYVEKQLLQSLATEPLILGTAVGERPQAGAPGIYLDSGEAVHIGERREDRVFIELDDKHLKGHGWVDASRVGRYFEGTTSHHRDFEAGEAIEVELSEPLNLLSQPGGTSFGQAFGRVKLYPLESVRSGHRLTAVTSAYAHQPFAIAWLPSSVLAEIRSGRRGTKNPAKRGGMPGGFTQGDGPPKVAAVAGSYLQTLSGETVGLIRKDSSWNCSEDCQSEMPVIYVDCLTELRLRVVPGASQG